MASTYSLRFRINYQAPGDNLNSWGTALNTGVFQLLEDAIAKRVNFALSGTKTLSTANGAADEARCAYLDVTSGSGGTITAPAVEKWYIVRNGATGNVILTTGSGLTVTVVPGEIVLCIGDGTNFRRVQSTDFGGAAITSIADPTTPQGAATKNYVDTTAFGMAAGSLPGQSGNDGKFLNTNAGAASWQWAVSAGAGLAVVSTNTVTVTSAAAADVRTGTSTAKAMTPGDTYNAFAIVTITYAASVAPDMGTFINGAITLTGNLTLANPTNHKVGQTGFIELIQDGTGSRLLSAVGSSWKRVGGLPTLSTTAGVTDILEYQVLSSTLILYDVLRNPT